ncbi:MAG: response regulator transcription factor [Lagierella massiliensis]|nr:response regulator transcription factor [Lagierella massiliensis]
METKYKILICDDEQEIIDLLKLYFDADKFEIFEAIDGEEGLKILQDNNIDVALIDIMMPKLNGFDLIKKVGENSDTHLIILSAMDSLSDKLKGYDIGACDYITKPFEPLEVLAKVKSRLKDREKSCSKLEIDNLTLDYHNFTLKVFEEVIDLTKVEFEVLKLFMESPNRVFSKEQIYEKGWEEPYILNENSVRVLINRLRSLVGSKRIQTIRGLGYRFKS